MPDPTIPTNIPETNPLDGIDFWELGGLFISALQMYLARENVDKYEDRLLEMADTLFRCKEYCPGDDASDEDWKKLSLAVKHRCRYLHCVIVIRIFMIGIKLKYQIIVFVSRVFIKEKGEFTKNLVV